MQGHVRQKSVTDRQTEGQTNIVKPRAAFAAKKDFFRELRSFTKPGVNTIYWYIRWEINSSHAIIFNKVGMYGMRNV